MSDQKWNLFRVMSRREEREPVSLDEAIAAARAVVASDKLHGKTSDPKVLELSERKAG